MTVFLHFYQGIYPANDSRGLNKDLVWLKSGSQPIIITDYMRFAGRKLKAKRVSFRFMRHFAQFLAGYFGKSIDIKLDCPSDLTTAGQDFIIG